VIVYVLTENEPHEGGSVMGVYSTDEKAREAAPETDDGFYYWEIIPVEVDTPPTYRSGEAIAASPQPFGR
jgi:hypothetical protein